MNSTILMKTAIIVGLALTAALASTLANADGFPDKATVVKAGGVGLPGLPIEPAAASAKPTNSAPELHAASKGPPSKSDSNPKVINVRPGVTEAITIAKGYLNRIVTPFDEPRAETTDDVATKVDGSVLFVATNSDKPVGLYVFAADNHERAISLLLIPKEIPPSEVTLTLADQPKKIGTPGRTNDAIAWERQEPYAETLVRLFRTLAEEKLPDGYAMTPINHRPALMPVCNLPGFRQTPAQELDGYAIIAFVERVENVSHADLEVDETGCAADGVLGAAAWPKVLLAPGESTEIYIAVRTPDPDQAVTARPSVAQSGVGR